MGLNNDDMVFVESLHIWIVQMHISLYKLSLDLKWNPWELSLEYSKSIWISLPWIYDMGDIWEDIHPRR